MPGNLFRFIGIYGRRNTSVYAIFMGIYKYTVEVFIGIYKYTVEGTGWPRPIGCLKLQVIFRKSDLYLLALLIVLLIGICKYTVEGRGWPRLIASLIFIGSAKMTYI